MVSQATVFFRFFPLMTCWSLEIHIGDLRHILSGDEWRGHARDRTGPRRLEGPEGLLFVVSSLTCVPIFFPKFPTHAQIVYCSLARMASKDMGPPLHSLIIPAPSLHPIEEEMLQTFLLCER
jgi:hypothetical protein